MFWRGVAFWRALAVGGAWHFGEAACSVLEGLAVFWWDACSVLEGCGILEEALAVVLKECGTFGGRLQCFLGMLAVFWRDVAFWRRRLQLF